MLRLRELRKKRGLTMKELGSIMGVAESTISQYETEKRQLDYEMLLKMSSFFDVSVDYILTGIEQKREPSSKKAGLSNAEITLLETFRKIPSEEQDRVIRIVQAASDSLQRISKPSEEAQ